MIIEWAVGVALAGASGWVVRRALRGRREDAPESAAASHESPSPSSSGASLGIGDVLLWEDQELWLAGEFSLMDAELDLRLFRAPDGNTERWVVWSSLRPEDVCVLRRSGTIPDGQVPSSLPLGGREHRLSRRGRGELRSAGEDLPPGFVGAASYALLDAAGGGSAILILDGPSGERLGLSGKRIPLDRIDRLPARS